MYYIQFKYIQCNDFSNAKYVKVIFFIIVILGNKGVKFQNNKVIMKKRYLYCIKKQDGQIRSH